MQIPQASPIKILSRRFRMMKAMRAQGIGWGQDYRRVGARTLKEVLEGRMAAEIDRSDRSAAPSAVPAFQTGHSARRRGEKQEGD